ncbi:hypothetical protein BCR35DRAFT_353477 [Leucosporidium creatinivorum]|uniref:Uncharacterized protein n=1 Tax=Leucosporidium creatinivorum TaxID=106004 RepID=A0A1Y2EYY7_9BASI|nr:hypothetical protein BCR35DRAFT_353477 [Leucosporidium creatinivorum]
MTILDSPPSTPDTPTSGPASPELAHPPPPFRRSTIGPAGGERHCLEVNLSRGNVLRVEERRSKLETQIQLSPDDPLDACAVLSGSLLVPASSSVASVAVRMYGVMEWMSTKAATASTNPAHPAPTGPTLSPTTTILFKSAVTRYAPKASSDEKDAIRLPFSFELPTTMDRYRTPPSFQRDGFGVRYFLEVAVERKTFTLRRNARDVIPIIYLPFSDPPTPNTPAIYPIEKGSPPLPPKDGQGFVETSAQVDNAHAWLSLLVPNNGIAARGRSLEVRIALVCDPQMADKIIPSCISVKLRDIGQASGSAAAPKTIAKSAEVTYYPSHLLPRPSSASSYAVGALDSRAFTATIDLGNDVCPTFETSATGPRAEYSVEVKIRLPKTKDQIISAPVRIVNCSRDVFELPKAYNKRDAKGGMKSAPSLV